MKTGAPAIRGGGRSKAVYFKPWDRNGKPPAPTGPRRAADAGLN
jgi:hypothetical protein